MTDKTKLAEAYAAYIALKDEERHCVKSVVAGEDAQIRLRQIRNNWSRPGELSRAENRYKELKFPLYDVDIQRTRRVVSVDEKWISLKTDGSVEATRFKRDTGKIERGRGDCEIIDVDKALKIWDEREIYDDLNALLPKDNKVILDFEISELLDLKLPVDVTFNSGTNKAGTTLRALAFRIRSFHEAKGRIEDLDIAAVKSALSEIVNEQATQNMTNRSEKECITNANPISRAPLILEENEKQKELIADLVEGLEAMLEQYDCFETDCISTHELSHRALAKANDFIKEVR